MSVPTNLFADFPASLPEELVQPLLTKLSIRIERIVSHGHASPEGHRYDQDQHEWVMLLTGAARLRFEGEDPIEMLPGARQRFAQRFWTRTLAMKESGTAK
jgi:cupin 2 domain-containing protein